MKVGIKDIFFKLKGKKSNKNFLNFGQNIEQFKCRSFVLKI